MRAVKPVDRGRDFDSTNWNLWESVVLVLVIVVVGLMVVERLWVDHLALSQQSSARSGSATTPAPVPTGTWTSLSDPIHAHEAASVAVLKDGRILIAGGLLIRGRNSSPSAETQIYNPKTDTWAAAAPMPSTRTQGTAIRMADGSVLVIGGISGDPPPIGSTQFPPFVAPMLYRPQTNEWVAVPEIPNGVGSGFVATLLTDGRVLVVGGSQRDGTGVATAFALDPLTLKWAEVGSMHTARAEASAVLMANGNLLIAGGWSSNAVIRSVEIFNPVTNRFSTASDMAVARSMAAVYQLSPSQILIAGGVSSQGVVSSAEIYSSASNAWSDAGRVPYGGAAVAFGLADGDVLAVVSGGVPLRISAQIFDPTTGGWIAGDQAIPGSGAIPNAVQTGDGRVIAISGIRVLSYKLTADLPHPTARPKPGAASSPMTTIGLLIAMGILLTLLGLIWVRGRYRKARRHI
jgi:N-acetylneuraminic acid mutarotase